MLAEIRDLNKPEAGGFCRERFREKGVQTYSKVTKSQTQEKERAGNPYCKKN